MSQVRNAALLLCLGAATIACNDAPNGGPTEPEVAPADPELSATITAPLAFRQVAAGMGIAHACGVTTENVAYCWGANNEGQLGDGTTTNRLRPVPVAGSLRFLQLSTGNDYTCGVTTEFKAYCWGSNFFATHLAGQLGDGTMTRRLRPRAVLGGLEFREVSTGLAHTCGRTTTNRAYCWGGNSTGQLGNGTRGDPRLTPVPVAGSLRFRKISVGNVHSCGVTPDDQAYCWGDNSDGQVGIGVRSSGLLSPTPVTGGHFFRTVDGGSFHTCGVTRDNQGFCWGDNIFGQLGIGETGGVRPRPRAVLGGLSFRNIEAGSSHNCGVTTLNRAYCWGTNQEGGLGDGTMTQRSTPVAVLGGHRFRQVTAGLLFSCGVRTDAAGYCWGYNGAGSLGDGTTTNRPRPRAVVAPS
jgi:alpha-tubulin suppressor-like RCC1 family protein